MTNSSDPSKKPIPPDDPAPKPSDEQQAEDDAFAELMSEDEGTGGSVPPLSGPIPSSASEVNLGSPSAARPQPPSGESSIDWADLVQDPSSSGQSARFDAPSDADVIPRALADKGQPEEVFDIRDDESAGRPEGSQDLGSSRIDLFERPPAEEPMQSLYHLAPGVESGLDLGS